jgi:hypothetical protein
MAAYGWGNWNTLNHREETCINLAIKWGNVRAFLWLLDEFYITSKAMTDAFSVAIENNKIDIATILIEHKANGFAEPPGKETPLHDATLRGYVDLVVRILQRTKHFEPHAFANSMCMA